MPTPQVGLKRQLNSSRFDRLTDPNLILRANQNAGN
jgi:hypothetical protein